MNSKLSKRIVSFLTSLLIIIGMVAYLPVMKANAQSYYNTSIPDFDVWKANVWINGYKDSNGEGFDSLYLNNITNPTFYAFLAEECLEDGSMNIPATLWAVIGIEEIRSNPNYFYEIMILNYLMSESKFQDFKSKLESHMIKAEYTIAKELAKKLGEDVDEQLPELIKNMTVEEATAYFEDITFTNELLDKVDVAYQAIDKAADLIDALATMYAVREVDKERIEFIKGLKAYATDNKPFCDAVDELVYIYSADIAGAWVAETSDYVSELCTWFAVESLSAFIAASPVAPYAAIIKGGIFALDTLFSTTEQSKQYFSLLAIYTMDCYAKQYLIDLKNIFINNPTEANAKKFNSTFIKYVEFQIYGLNASKEILSVYMVDNIYAYLSQNNYESYYQICDTIDSQIGVKMSYLKIDSAFRKLYIDTYNLGYLDDKENTDVAAESIAFENSEITVPLSYGTTAVKAIFNPVDTTNTNVTATSSDERVASVDFTMCNLISLKLNSVGTTTITAVSEDGGYTAEMTINVVNSVNETVVETPASDFEYTKYSNHVEITKYIGSDTKVVIPYFIEGLPVTNIGNDAFSNFYSLTSVTIPDSVTNIGDDAFSYCENLTSITIPNSVTSIGGDAFYKCKSLTSITIPDSVTYIGDSAFSNCYNLAEINIPDSVTYIGDSAFYYCYNLTGIKIPDGVTTIENGTFEICSSLTSITIPDSVTYIGDSAFSNCYNLAEINIPDSVTYIGDYTFHSCASLTEINIPDGVTYIGVYAFDNCDSLTTEINISDSVTYIGDYAFYRCSSLASISVSADNEYYCSVDGVLFNKKKTTLIAYPAGKTDTSYTVPDSVTAISDNAFVDCDNLTSITIPDGITIIGVYTFNDCDYLTSVTIPDSVTYIDSFAFSDCDSLTSITIPDSVISIEDWAFYNCSSLKSITIPDSVTTIGEYALGYCYDDDYNPVIVDGFVISCYENSAAHTYAVNNEFDYKLLDKVSAPTAMKGFKLGGRAADALRLNWTKNTSADGYIIEQYKDGKWVRIKKITSNATTTYRVTGLAAGTAYKFRMKAYVTDGTNALYSGYTSTLAARTNPSNVTGLKIGGRASNALRLNWTKNTSADGYIIEQYKDGKWVRIKKITSNATTTYRVAGLKASTQYKFRVRAYKMSGKTALYSGYTKTLSAYTNPSKVANLKITGKAKTALRLGWSKNTSADGYIVEMYKGGKWVRAAKITSNATLTFRKSGLKKGTTYKFRVRTYNMVGSTALYGGYVNVSGTTNK